MFVEFLTLLCNERRNQNGPEQFTNSVNDQWEICAPFPAPQARSRQPAEGNIPFRSKNVLGKELCPVVILVSKITTL
jgi:hypothetical protein